MEKTTIKNIIDYIDSIDNIGIKKIHNEKFEITGFSSISNTKPNTISWVRKQLIDWNIVQASLIIAEDGISIPNIDLNIITVKNPRLLIAKLLLKYEKRNVKMEIHITAVIDEKASIGKNVSIGAYSFISQNVTIGDNTQIGRSVVINDNVTIGENCFIKSNTVIGEDGFGVEFDNNGTIIDIPHIGGVRIGNDVRIGALCTVVRGTIEDTIIEDNVKTDDHVHIAHNVFIGKSTRITACAEISGSVKVGKNVWFGPNCSIVDGIEIGDGAFISIGSVVTKNVKPGEKITGNFGIPHDMFIRHFKELRGKYAGK